MTTGEARINRGMVGDAATEPVADEDFDRIGFVEATHPGHTLCVVISI